MLYDLKEKNGFVTKFFFNFEKSRIFVKVVIQFLKAERLSSYQQILKFLHKFSDH